MNELRKSINSILYQRITSPLFGTFTFSWLIWNWKIIYLTFFIDEGKIGKNKIDYIIDNFSEVTILVYYPLLSTLILLTLIPFLSNGSYWLSLKFEKWKIDNKNKIENKQLLTLEQSIELREQIIESEIRLDSLLKSKSDEIKQLKLLVKELKEQQNSSFGDPLKAYEDAKKQSEAKLKEFDSLEDARKELGSGKDFYYSEANLHGIVSPEGKTLGKT